MSSVEEITALREELAAKRAQRKGSEDDGVAARRQAELDREAAKLRREIDEEDAVAALLASAGQSPEATEVTGSVRTDEEILLAAAAAQAIANGVTQEEVDAHIAELKTSKVEEADKVQAKPEAVKLTGGTPSPVTGVSSTASAATTEQEK